MSAAADFVVADSLVLQIYINIIHFCFVEWICKLSPNGLQLQEVGDLTESELINAPERVRNFFSNLKEDQKEKVQVTPDVLKLAEAYVTEKVVGETSIDDCIHIATATIYKVDLLVSWNFKHIVNVYRIRGYNSVNLKLGYTTLNIHSPKEIVGNGNEE